MIEIEECSLLVPVSMVQPVLASDEFQIVDQRLWEQHVMPFSRVFLPSCPPFL